jgi:hypothetical protein
MLPLPVATPLLHLLHRAGVLLVGCCVIFINRRPSKAMTYFCCRFFLRQFAAPSKETTPPHTFRLGRLSSSMPLPLSTPTFGWLLCPPIKQQPSKAKGPPISLFFLSIDIPPQTMGNPPPHTFQPGLASSPMHPLTSTTSSIWLLFILIKRRPPKAKEPPHSLLFDASYFTSPCKQTNDSKRNPDGSRPAHGVGERRHHDLVVPLLYPWRERGHSHWRVGWHGSSFWLLCLCMLCFVFCAASKTIWCSWVSPYLIFWKMKIMSYVFWRVPSSIKLRPEKKVLSSGCWLE